MDRKAETEHEMTETSSVRPLTTSTHLLTLAGGTA